MTRALSVVSALLLGLALLTACAGPGASVALLDDERCTRYGGLWLASAGSCSHPSSTGR